MLSLTPPLRFCKVSGIDNRQNDIIFCPPAIKSDENSTVVYFGGDVQDFPEAMKIKMENHNHLKWNLDNTATILNVAFPYSNIVVIRPSRIEFNTFSCYDNFVISNEIGVPEHRAMYLGINHLKKLLQNTQETIKSTSNQRLIKMMESSAENQKLYMDFDLVQDCLKSKKMIINTSKDECKQLWWLENLLIDESKLILVGFSKGCVVLNQFLYEMHFFKTKKQNDELDPFVNQISDMFWLDGGHGGQRNTWITSDKVLEAFSKYKIRVHIHVTPYQMKDKRRTWIRKEEQCFYLELQKLGMEIDEMLHFEDVKSSLDVHFNVLKVFNNNKEIC